MFSDLEVGLQLAVIALLVLSMALYIVPEKSCDQCVHCRQARVARESHAHEQRHRLMGDQDRCSRPLCKKDDR